MAELVDTLGSESILFAILFFIIKTKAFVAQLEEALDSNPIQCAFESHQRHKTWDSSSIG